MTLGIITISGSSMLSYKKAFGLENKRHFRIGRRWVHMNFPTPHSASTTQVWLFLTESEDLFSCWAVVMIFLHYEIRLRGKDVENLMANNIVWHIWCYKLQIILRRFLGTVISIFTISLVELRVGTFLKKNIFVFFSVFGLHVSFAASS